MTKIYRPILFLAAFEGNLFAAQEIPAMSAGEQFKLGMAYYKEEKYEKAFDSLEQAAHHGHVKAQFNLGVLCRKGLGTQQSNVKAFKWFQEAAKQGDPGGQYNLGLILKLMGRHEEGNELIRKAADQGYEKAEGYLAR